MSAGKGGSTIFAVSTGIGRSAVAVVRVSGPAVDDILMKACGRTGFKGRRATLATIFDENGAAIDRAIVIRFLAPQSFTGEDMVEFQVTGGRAVVGGLLRCLTACSGARPAEAGEFALRAFENGKLDLAEVEGLAAVVEAETRAQLKQALILSSGKLSRQCERVRELLLQSMAAMESMLDFSDVEDAADLNVDAVLAPVQSAADLLRDLLAGGVVSERLREGMTVVLAGAPNSGKSTLLNYLARRDVAIVSPTPGTTRDLLEVSADVAGYPVTFVDTAGIRLSSDPIEAEGIARAKSRSAKADLVLWLSESQDTKLPADAADWRVLPVRTKSDLRADTDARLSISAMTGDGVEALIAKIAEFAAKHFEGVGRIGVGTERQLGAAKEALAALQAILSEPGQAPELMAEDLRSAIHSLGRIVGRIGVEEVLGEIFSRLCVGK